MTNGDKIRNMNDRELAEFLCESVGPDTCGTDCPWYRVCQLDPVNLHAWLKQEADKNEQTAVD